MLVSIAFIALLSLAYSNNCQYVIDPDFKLPIGIDRCNFAVSGSGKNQTKYSFSYKCDTNSSVIRSSYYGSFDCTGPYNTIVITKSNGTLECGDSYVSSCGKLFGYKYPCSCSVDNGDCSDAVEFALVDQTCFASSTNKSRSQSFDITCGFKTQVVRNDYKTTDCSGNIESQTIKAGCQSSSFFPTSSSHDKIDVVVCSTKTTFSSTDLSTSTRDAVKIATKTKTSVVTGITIMVAIIAIMTIGVEMS